MSSHVMVNSVCRSASSHVLYSSQQYPVRVVPQLLSVIVSAITWAFDYNCSALVCSIGEAPAVHVQQPLCCCSTRCATSSRCSAAAAAVGSHALCALFTSVNAAAFMLFLRIAVKSAERASCQELGRLSTLLNTVAV
jgi:hypothetical protein